MDELINCLKECNVKLDALSTADYSYVAWIIFSTKHSCFIAGVDTYYNYPQSTQWIATREADVSPVVAMNKVYMKICQWSEGGDVLPDHPLNE